MRNLLSMLFLALFALAAPAAAQTFPPLTGRVVDQAHLLNPAQVADLTRKSEALEQQTGRQLVIATVPSLQGYSVEDYSNRLFRQWKLGQAKLNNGVLLLIAPAEHKVRIEVGYGLTPYLTDAMSGVIIREAITPRFKEGDMGGGIEAGADAIIQQMALSPDEAQKNVAAAAQAERSRQHSGAVLPGIFWFMVVGFLLLGHFRRGYGRTYRTRSGGISPWVALWALNSLNRGSRWGGGGWGGGSPWGGDGGFGGGGGFGGFSGGGGSSGGGGASGSW